MLLRVCLPLFLLVSFSLSAQEPSKKRPIRVYADISGDLFHAGHVAFLKKAKELGDELVVGVLADHDIQTYKRMPILTLEERVAVIEACRYVDRVIAACPLCASRQWLEEQEIDVVVHGDDFDPEGPLAQSQYGPAIDMGIFITIPYTQGISTSNIIKRIERRFLAYD